MLQRIENSAKQKLNWLGEVKEQMGGWMIKHCEGIFLQNSLCINFNETL